jgi:diguanylate cyclase
VNDIAPVVFLTGVFIGTILLVLGIGLGWFLGRRSIPNNSSAGESLEQRQVLDFIRNFASFTNEFAGDFSKYQAKLTSLSKNAQAKGDKATSGEVQSLIDEILDANRSLQSRLDTAEVRLEQQTQELSAYLTEARTDALTGLPNRRAFDQGIDEAFKNWKEKRVGFALALLDIDFFKSINDNLGHPAGDAVLVEVAGRLKRFAGTEFKIGRYGGEEFAVLIQTTLKPAAQQIEKLRLLICDSPVMIEQKPVRVTVSCGVAEIRDDERLGELFHRSDTALYSAKVGGRNRVFLHNGNTCEPYGNPGPAEQARFQTSTADKSGNTSESQSLETMKTKLQARFDDIVAKELHRPGVK